MTQQSESQDFSENLSFEVRNKELRIRKDAFKIKVLKYCNVLYKSCLFKHNKTGQMSDLAAIVEEKHQLFPI